MFTQRGRVFVARWSEGKCKAVPVRVRCVFGKTADKQVQASLYTRENTRLPRPIGRNSQKNSLMQDGFVLLGCDCDWAMELRAS